jgi:hypothetical protein
MPIPSTRSPGYIVFRYQVGGNVHTTGFAMLSGVDVRDVAAMQTVADHLGPLVAACLPNTAAMLDWHTTDRSHHELIGGSFTSDLIGGLTDSAPGWKSFTVTLTGIERGSDGSYRNGKTRCVLFVSGTRQPSAGEKVIGVAGDASLAALAADLASSVVYWAGYYGVKANIHGVAPVQFNAAAQKRHGC